MHRMNEVIQQLIYQSINILHISTPIYLYAKGTETGVGRKRVGCKNGEYVRFKEGIKKGRR